MQQKDKTALITGACGGIGMALCDAFSQAGYRVLATDKEQTALLKCEKFIACDLLDTVNGESSIHSLKESVLKCLGADELNVLVNNAALQILGSARDISPESWQNTLQVNLTSPMFLVQAFLDALEAAHGSVVNVTSVHAIATKPAFIAYATSKAALEGLTRALAIDLGGKVRVNSVSPAATETPMLVDGFKGNMAAYQELNEIHPVGRIAKPSEIARAAVFLASEDAQMMTGSCLRIDGGILSRLHDPV